MSATDTFDRLALRAQLVAGEALKLRWYWDNANPRRRSIGIGRNLDDVGIRPAEQHALGITVASCIARGITVAQAYYLCDSDVDVCVAALDAKLPWWRGLSPVRQRVLLDMCFNMGIGRAPLGLMKGKGLLAFQNTLAKVKAGDYAAAAAGMEQSAWDGQVGTRADRLEAMMRTGLAS